jgi:hypothetical protein
LAVSHEPKVLIDAIGGYYKVKPSSWYLSWSECWESPNARW